MVLVNRTESILCIPQQRLKMNIYQTTTNPSFFGLCMPQSKVFIHMSILLTHSIIPDDDEETTSESPSNSLISLLSRSSAEIERKKNDIRRFIRFYCPFVLKFPFSCFLSRSLTSRSIIRSSESQNTMIHRCLAHVRSDRT